MSNISVELISSMGSDKRVAEVARISFANAGFDLPEEISEKDESLIKYLARGISTKEYSEILDVLTHGTGSRADAVELFSSIKHQATHWTPFAQNSFTILCKAPVPIRTQLFKHTIGLVANEESRRYISGTPELFQMEDFRAKPDGSIKQGSGIIHPESKAWLNVYNSHVEEAVALYEELIAEGICPEQARFVLPQGVMVNWVWTGNLFAFANVFNKRSDTHAQKEVQEFAFLLEEVIKPVMPVSWDALTRSQLK